MKKTMFLAIAFTAFVGVSTVSAQTKWQQHHPRRTEVNARLHNQNRRIHHEVREGEMSHAEARRLHHEDHQVRHEERAMALNQHGHITRAQKRALNQQENGIGRQIGR